MIGAKTFLVKRKVSIMANDKYVASPPALTPDEGDWRENPVPHAPMPGNHSDDDGSYIDEMYEAMPTGPQEFVGAIPQGTPEPTTTRILSRTILLTQNQPQMFYPADSRRLSLSVAPGVNMDFSGGAFAPEETLRIGTSKSDCYGAADIPFQTFASGMMTLEGYTGAIWLMAPASTGIAFSVWCHTR